jgi:hypothetical protein
MTQEAFDNLLELLVRRGELKDGKDASASTKLAVTLGILRSAERLSSASIKWGIPRSTIDRHFQEVLICMSRIRHLLMVQPQPGVVPPQISGDPMLAPFFHHALGAIDGTHIPAFAPRDAVDKDQYINRKTRVTQNVFAAANFDGTFCFIYTGSAGSVSDVTVLRKVMPHEGLDERRETLPIYPGYYWLADAGYTLTTSCLTPFPSVPYHRPNQAPFSEQEQFNRLHAKARKCIECSFGVLKSRFHMLRDMAPYSFDVQQLIVHACVCLHNFIIMHRCHGNDWFDSLPAAPPQPRTSLTRSQLARSYKEAAEFRKSLAKAMWTVHIAKLRQHHKRKRARDAPTGIDASTDAIEDENEETLV